MSTFSSCSRAIRTAAWSSAPSCALVIPTDEPSRAGLPQRHVAGDGNAAVAQDGLTEVLVHADGGGGDARPDVGHARELEQALHRPVLAERPVQDRQHDVDLAERPRGSRVGQHGEGL
jgi:hypothetical protein